MDKDQLLQDVIGYLGDGAYLSQGSYQGEYILWTPRGHEIHWIALDQGMLRNLQLMVQNGR